MKQFRIAGVLTVVALAGVGCGSDSDSGSSSSSSSSGTSGTSASADGLGGKKVFLLGCGSAVPYCAAQNKSFKSELSSTGANVSVLESNYDPAVQSQQLNQAISQQADIIALVPAVQEPLMPALTKAKTADIPVLLLNNPPDPAAESLFTSWIGQDDALEATQSAEQMIEGLGKIGKAEGNILVVAGAPGAATDLRRDAFTKAIEASSYKIIDEANGEWDPVKATSVAQQLFAKHKGDFVAVYAMSGAMGAGVVQAAKQSNLPTGEADQGLIITGNNCDPTSIKAIQEGDMYADINQSPVDDGKAAADAVKTLFDEGSLPARITSDTPVINAETVDQYAENCTF